MHCDR
jgi:clathrin heavy chain